MSRLEANSLAAPRVPKLQVRNRTPLDQDSISTSSGGDTGESDDAITSIPPRGGNAFPSPRSSSSSGPTSERRLSTSTTVASNASSCPSKSPKKTKKKGPSVLGFLTLKEPSQTALEQFAERTRKQAAEKAGTEGLARVSAVGLPGVSTQKLPPTVPKVNSKWDGIPESVKAKEMQRRRESFMSKTLPGHSLEGSYSTRFANHSSGSLNPPNSLTSSSGSLKLPRRPPSLSSSVSSSGSQPRDLVLRYANRPKSVFDPAAAGLKTRASLTSPSMSSLPEISYFFPDDIKDEGTSPETLPVTPKNASSVSASKDSSRKSRPNDIIVPINADDVAWARSPTLVEFNTETKNGEAQNVLRRISANYQGFLAGEAQEVVLPDDDESVREAPSVLGDAASEVAEEPLIDPDSVTGMEPTAEYLLFATGAEPAGELETVQEVTESESEETPKIELPVPNIPAKNPNRYSSPKSPSSTRTNFSRPLSYQPPLEKKPLSRPSTANTNTPTTSLSTPTVMEAATTDDVVMNLIPQKNNTHLHQRQYSDAASIAGSVAASTIAPSEMSARWFQSPRERLGLGSRIKKTDVLPWEMAIGERGMADKKNKRNRLSLFGKGAA